jgi:hypothetical protein
MLPQTLHLVFAAIRGISFRCRALVLPGQFRRLDDPLGETDAQFRAEHQGAVTIAVVLDPKFSFEVVREEAMRQRTGADFARDASGDKILGRAPNFGIVG